MIDPQMQANIWIREMQKRADLLVIRPNASQNELLFQLENAVTYGKSVLLENIGEEID